MVHDVCLKFPNCFMQVLWFPADLKSIALVSAWTETLQANGLPPVIDSQTHICVKVRVSFQNHNIKFHFTKNFNQIFFECRMKQQLHGEATALLVFFFVFARWIQRLANHTRLWLQPHPLPRVFSHVFQHLSICLN